MSDSLFIKAQHPKTSVKPSLSTLQKIIDRAWVAQFKIHGHRAQIHIPANKAQDILIYNRQGQLHKAKLPFELEDELRRLLSPESAWNVIDGEWLKGPKKIFIFDFIKRNGELLNNLTYSERYEYLPRIYRSDYVETLALFYSANSALNAVEGSPDYVEGLVLKSLRTKGFHDTSIVRCRFPGRSPHA